MVIAARRIKAFVEANLTGVDERGKVVAMAVRRRSVKAHHV